MIGSDIWSDEDGFDIAIATTGITGICGSGIIEAVAEMRMAGLLDASGLIGSAAQTGTERCIADGRTNSYVMWDGSENGGPKITVTNPDIRAIQIPAQEAAHRERVPQVVNARSSCSTDGRPSQSLPEPAEGFLDGCARECWSEVGVEEALGRQGVAARGAMGGVLSERLRRGGMERDESGLAELALPHGDDAFEEIDVA